MTTAHLPGIVHHLEASDDELRARRTATSLRNWLRVNTGFSLTTGLVGLGLGGWVADVLDVDNAWIVRTVAGGLVAFAVFVFVIAGTRTSELLRWSGIVSVADLGWVAATPMVIALGWLSTAGAFVMATIGVAVFDLAIVQLRLRRRLTCAVDGLDGTIDESPPVELHTATRSVAGAPAELWPIITDHALYARLALNLETAENLTPNGPGFERACTDSLGRTWSETCTLWDQGRRFDVEVDTSDYPYPLQTMQGSWRLDPRGEAASDVTMVFAFQPTPGLAGRLMVPAMHLLFPPILRRIAKGWETACRSVPAGFRSSR